MTNGKKALVVLGVGMVAYVSGVIYAWMQNNSQQKAYDALPDSSPTTLYVGNMWYSWYTPLSTSLLVTAPPAVVSAPAPKKQTITNVSSNVMASANTGYSVSSGALPVTANDAELVLLSPNATAAQVAAAQNIQSTPSQSQVNAGYGIS